MAAKKKAGTEKPARTGKEPANTEKSVQSRLLEEAAKSEAPTADSGAAEKLIWFIQQNRRVIIGGFFVLVVVLIGAMVVLAVREEARVRDFVAIDALEQRQEPIKRSLANELQTAAENVDLTGDDALTLDALTERTAEVPARENQAEIDLLLADLGSFAAKKTGFAAQRAFAMQASIYHDLKSWTEAQAAWTAAFDAAPKTYFAPILLFNAAAAAEENGAAAGAVELFKRVAKEFNRSAQTAAHALFSAGRILDTSGDTAGAVALYRELLSQWPQDALWANLAQSRIISLGE
jgi:tetratricopeptide (TPR) repeat protein